MKTQIFILSGMLCFAGCASTQSEVKPDVAPTDIVQNASDSENAHGAEAVKGAENVKGAAVDIPSKYRNAADDALRRAQDQADVMIYESWPEETTLDNDFIANVIPVWIEAVNSAEHTIDFSEFYAIRAEGKALDPVLKAIRAATERGVKIRFIFDDKMSGGENAELPKQLSELPNTEVRIISYSSMTSGVQHAKYFIVDGKTAYFGSQNLDWRSLDQISEMGARLRLAALVEPLKAIFEADWKLAEQPGSVAAGECYPSVEVDYKGEKTQVQTVASPKNYLPCASSWDLPHILSMIDQAQTSVSVQLLNYATTNYDKTTFTEIDDAFKRAAARGVRVRLLVSDWSTRPKYIKDLKRLAAIDNIETRMIAVPEHSEGFVPFSRTIHSKFMVVDDDQTWLGTSNWSGDYFYNSRNVGIVAKGKTLNDELTRSFNHYWNSEYAIVVDPNVDYPVKNQAKKE